jgi:hypothetical protein
MVEAFICKSVEGNVVMFIVQKPNHLKKELLATLGRCFK